MNLTAEQAAALSAYLLQAGRAADAPADQALAAVAGQLAMLLDNTVPFQVIVEQKPAPQQSHEDWMKDYAARRAKFAADMADCMAFNKAQIFPPLKAAGISQVHVQYSGSGDSGQIDEVCGVGVAEKGKPAPAVDIPDVTVTIRMARMGFGDYTGKINQEEAPLKAAIEDLCWTLLDVEHAGFENNDGGEGVFTLDVETQTIALDHSDFIMQSEHSTSEW